MFFYENNVKNFTIPGFYPLILHIVTILKEKFKKDLTKSIIVLLGLLNMVLWAKEL